MTHIPVSVAILIAIVGIAVYCLILALPQQVKDKHVPFQASCVREIPGVFDYERVMGE